MPELRSVDQADARRQKLTIRANHGIVTNRDRTDIQHGQIPVRVKIFTDMDINTVIRNELRIHGNIFHQSNQTNDFDNLCPFETVRLSIEGPLFFLLSWLLGHVT